MSRNREGARRKPVSGFGPADDNERWFRFYHSEVMVDLLQVSADSFIVYMSRLAEAYHVMGQLEPFNVRRVQSYMGATRARRAIGELREVGLFVGPRDEPKHYEERNHGFAIQRKPISPEIRNFVFARDGWACVYCGATERLSIDHIIPVTACGSDDPENLVCACRSCNASKGNVVIGSEA